LISRDLAIPEDLMEEAGTDDLARVRGHDRAAPVLMPQEMVAAFHPQNSEARLRER
jgi:hypothetical protein